MKIKIILLILTLLALSCSNRDETTNGDCKKSAYMWFDCEANFERLSSADSVEYYLQKIKDIGFTDAVVDVKSIMGETLFRSKYAPYMNEWKGYEREKNYDILAVFIEKGKKIGINIHASLNVFSGGNNFHSRGIVYSEPDKAKWQSVFYWFEGGENGLRPISEMKWNYNCFLNPALPEVQKYQLNIIKEVVTNYPDLKGIVLDRVRYDGITSDFSEFSKNAFQKYANLKVEKFPQDIMFWKKDNKEQWQWEKGKLFNKWIEWRASIIHDFIKKVRSEIKAINPNILYIDYTGAWYPVYYETGVNWASKNYDPSVEYDWATKDYKNYGYAKYLDLWMGGLYFTEVTIKEVEEMNEKAMKTRKEAAMGKGREYWYSVEGCADLAHKVIKGDVPICGSILVDQYKTAEHFKRAVEMAKQKTDALMLFDISHIIQLNWWHALDK